MALSGIVLSGSPGGASLVRYHPGQRVFYACQVLNPRRAADGSIRVGVQATLFRDQRLLGSSRFILLDGKDQPDLKRLLVADDFRLGQQLPSGDYTLQVVAVDQNAAPKVTASQSIDFEATNLQ